MTQSKEWWHRAGQKIASRDWDDIESQWRSDLSIVNNLNQSNSGQLINLASFRDVITRVDESNEKSSTVEGTPGIRNALLGEGVFHYKKSLNVFCNSEISRDAGYCSWSIFNSYQSSFFAAKAILAILGISVVESGAPFLVDVFSGRKRLSKGDRKRNVKSDHEIHVIKAKARNVEHRPIWHFLLTTIRKSQLDLNIDQEIETQLVELETADFGKTRNAMLYRIFEWPFPSDLQSPQPNSEYGNLIPDDKSGRILEPSNLSFNFNLAVILAYLAYSLLSKLCSVGGAIGKELGGVVGLVSGGHTQLEANFRRLKPGVMQHDND